MKKISTKKIKKATKIFVVSAFSFGLLILSVANTSSVIANNQYYPGASVNNPGSSSSSGGAPGSTGTGTGNSSNNSSNSNSGGSGSTGIDQCKGRTDGSGINCLVELVVNILSMAVGGVALLMMVVGAVMYASAGDDSGRVAAAKGIITKTVIGVIVYVFLYAILNFVIPGGI